MKRGLFIFAAAMWVASAGAITASQAWVKDYIMRLNGGTNRVVSIDAGTNGTITARYSPADRYALFVTNSVLPDVTNGVIFAWTGRGGEFTNRFVGAGITATRTNFVFRGVPSRLVQGVDTFTNCFGVLGCAITQGEERNLQ